MINLHETETFKKLVVAIDEEIADPAYAGRTHGNMSGYNAGCRGPMCIKANTDRRKVAHRRSIDDEYIDWRFENYMEEKLDREREARNKVRPPGTTREDYRAAQAS